MNGRKAKRIRKEVYGKEDYRKREYTSTIMRRYEFPDKHIEERVMVRADVKRTIYQKMKRL